MESIWSGQTDIPRFEPLKNNIKTDVLVIGGGIAGILCARLLKDAGVECVLVEADRVCSKITKNTTAKITIQHGLIYSKLLGRFGKQKTLMYLNANQAALQKFRELCKDIDCDFEEKDSFVYSLSDRFIIEKELSSLNTLDFKADFVSELPLPFSVAGAVRFKNQAQFNPIKFLSAVTDGLEIYEQTRVLEVSDDIAVTEHSKIEFKKAIVATHFPFINKHGSFFMKMYQHRSYVVALKNVPDVNGMYVDQAENGLSFRNYNGHLLLGGGGHRTGTSGGGWQGLTDFAKKYYPESEEVCRWATQDCMTLDGVAYIGNYSALTENIYVTTGFNKWGMTSSMVGAMILSDIIMGKKNPYCEMFSPSRTILRPQLAVNMAHYVADLLSFSQKRCPHLGCALKWNKFEHSWDCPCHGSRFTQDGNLIDNPATGDIK